MFSVLGFVSTFTIALINDIISRLFFSLIISDCSYKEINVSGYLLVKRLLSVLGGGDS